jgi:hypothetical protein
MRKTLALVGTAINVFIPGVGSLLMGKFSTGAIQLGLILAVLLLKFISFGFLGVLLWPVTLAVWFWAVGGGVMTYMSLPSHHKALE